MVNSLSILKQRCCIIALCVYIYNYIYILYIHIYINVYAQFLWLGQARGETSLYVSEHRSQNKRYHTGIPINYGS